VTSKYFVPSGKIRFVKGGTGAFHVRDITELPIRSTLVFGQLFLLVGFFLIANSNVSLRICFYFLGFKCLTLLLSDLPLFIGFLPFLDRGLPLLIGQLFLLDRGLPLFIGRLFLIVCVKSRHRCNNGQRSKYCSENARPL